MMSYRSIIVAMTLTSAMAFTSETFGQRETCSLTTYFVDLKTKASMSRFLISEFPLNLSDDDFAREFVDKESGRKIFVGGQLVILYKKVPILRLKLSFDDRPHTVYTYDSLDGAEAETIYDKKWRWLSVSDEFTIGDRIYTYTFGCERVRK